MIDELFNELNREKLSDWGVVLLGVSGIPGPAEHLSRAVVKDFSSAELEAISINDPVFDFVVDLATDGCETTYELSKRLDEICQAKKVDLKLSRRKWRFISLQDLLSDLDPDPVYGLIKLSEFWAAWEWPIDIPSSMRSDSQILPQDYHSQLNYENVLQNHRKWLRVERTALQ